ncbi:hypothetical protein FKW77_002615 [Venturia effusa]|uniref:Uncharacterized protein n=1 Tax=Venturia effusa TaxID=50376 RepID=A0A517LMD5_9PEZI|nr:hypothetical protein FKW77_002615 [Venturia effusa]
MANQQTNYQHMAQAMHQIVQSTQNKAQHLQNAAQEDIKIAQNQTIVSNELANVANTPAIVQGNQILNTVNAVQVQMNALQAQMAQVLNAVNALTEAVNHLRTENASERHNLAARLVNSRLTPRQQLNALHDIANQAIPHFPATQASIDSMNDARVSAVLLALGVNVQPTMSLKEKKEVLETSIGISDIRRE